MAIVRLGNDVCGAGCASAGAIIVIGRFSEVTGRGKRLRPARRWKSWMPTFGPSGAKPNPLSRGTEGSNPALSSAESAANLTPGRHGGDATSEEIVWARRRAESHVKPRRVRTELTESAELEVRIHSPPPESPQTFKRGPVHARR